ncbi:MAG: ATP-binding cassette domain-containing protein [Acidimicrobiales bacterium]|nr:ATP-binding cassette domain-containing protein [Acidimicrobiales bacterium]
MSTVASSDRPLELVDVGFRRDDRWILRDVSWSVGRSDRWVVLGPNGSGKSTLLDIASMWQHPTTGTVRVLGEELGRCDVRTTRGRVGVSSAALADRLRPTLEVDDLVVTGLRGDLETWWHEYTDGDRVAAAAVLERLGITHLRGRTFGTLSSGERQRVQMARTLIAEPDLLFLDEPFAGLDLGAREDLLARLSGLASDASVSPMVLVTHHVEEIPVGFTHALLLRAGRIVAAGPVAEALTEETLSETFGMGVQLVSTDGRWRAWARS